MKENILSIIKRKNTNFENLLNLSEISESELTKVLEELVLEKKIFLNSSSKYEIMNEEYYVATLDRNSKGVSFVNINNERIIIPPEELHTALKYDTVVVEITHEAHGTVKGIIERKNNKLVCEVKAHNNKLVLVPFNGNCEIYLITPKELLKDYIINSLKKCLW